MALHQDQACSLYDEETGVAARQHSTIVVWQTSRAETLAHSTSRTLSTSAVPQTQQGFRILEMQAHLAFCKLNMATCTGNST